jgi:PPK2 family polyphosphate:nucleotide phosphotransferase
MNTDRIDPSPYAWDGSRPFRIADAPTRVPALGPEKKAEQLLDSLRQEIDELQRRMYAHDRFALLCLFQAMDAAGKDGTIRAVFSGVNPHGLEVHAFKAPSEDELDHSFFWRTERVMPPRGRIGVFNRSYYEEILVCRVHPEIVIRGQRLPEADTEDLERLWAQRQETIRALERNHHANGTRIRKFFLHLSREEQRRRFLERIADPAKNWKFREGDVRERARWDEYMAAYEDAVNATATPDCPWHVIPADDKKTARLLVAAVIRDTLRALPMSYPAPDNATLAALAKCRAELEAQAGDA